MIYKICLLIKEKLLFNTFNLTIIFILYMLLNLFLYIIIFLIIIFVVNKFSFKYDFLDRKNKRKLHKRPVPYTGGISLMITIIILLNFYEISVELKKIILISSLLCIFNLFDDRYDLSPGIKLALIAIPAFFLILNDKFIIKDLGSYEFIGLIDLAGLEIIFTFLCVLYLVNSFNYIDGIDGLAISQFIIFLTFYYFLVTGENNKNFFISLILISLIFLICNCSKNNTFKIFLGNNGSIMIGFIISFFSIYFNIKENIHPTVIIWPMWLYVYDFLSVFLSRLLNNKKIFRANKIDHVHHVLINKLKISHLKTTMILSCLSISLILIGIIINFYIGEIYSLLTFVIFFGIYHYLKLRFLKDFYEYSNR